MSLNELRHYVIAHREDQEAWDEYASRPRSNATVIPADTPPEEAEEILAKLFSKKEIN